MNLNVLIYTSPSTNTHSAQSVIRSLRLILKQNYVVQNLPHSTLIREPWRAGCALLVIPGSNRGEGGSLLVPRGAQKQIKSFVENDKGRVLVLGTGCRVGSGSVYNMVGSGLRSLSFGDPEDLDEEVALRFWDRDSGCYVSFDSTEENEDEDNDIEVDVVPAIGATAHGLDSVPAEISISPKSPKTKEVDVLARLGSNHESFPVAGLAIPVNEGKVAVWRSSIEIPLSDNASKSLTEEERDTNDNARLNLLRITLTQLGLQVASSPDDNQEDDKQLLALPLPQFLTSTPSRPEIVPRVLDAIAENGPGEELIILNDFNDKFHFHPMEETDAAFQQAREASAAVTNDPSTWQPRDIIVCRDGQLPSLNQTPLFDIAKYYEELAIARKQNDLEENKDNWGVGEVLLYGQSVTSTQTMLDKNPRLLSTLPTPFLSLASHQLSGRGRGANVWLSPSGCLQFSLLLRIPLSAFPAPKIVFVQYIFGLAVVEACRDEGVLGEKLGESVKLKWPNDLYVSINVDGTRELRKVGGILINTSFSGGKVDLVIGCGLNVLNPPPITSLSQLKHDGLTMERTAACIMAKFEPMWNRFVEERGSFDSFMDLYLQRWLHSDQLVTLTTTTPHTKVRIMGITSDYGLLRTLPEAESAGYIDLQPDGNSFDLMANLIKSKSS